MEQLYEDREEFKKDYQTARLEHKLQRKYKIRGSAEYKKQLDELPPKKFQNEWNNFSLGIF